MKSSGFGVRLRAERIRLHLTQDVFATACGVQTRAQVSYEQGERFPTVGYLFSAGELGADLHFLLTGEYLGMNAGSDVASLIAGYHALDGRAKASVLTQVSLLKRAPTTTPGAVQDDALPAHFMDEIAFLEKSRELAAEQRAALWDAINTIIKTAGSDHFAGDVAFFRALHEMANEDRNALWETINLIRSHAGLAPMVRV